MDRVILHCDLNSFFASVELISNPELRDKPVAVCGNTQERHGIVLAKNDVAKKYGIVTGEPVIHAKNKCRGLITIPPHYEQYLNYSRKVKDIYYKYTDQVESFGIDECWLDVTGSLKLFGDGYEIAKKINRDIYIATGLTVSIGVSFNKIFAKLGSDIKKPNGITVINKDDFKEKIWGLQASDLLGVGRQTANKLKRRGVKTIGQLASIDSKTLELWFGKCGLLLWVHANGLDSTPVSNKDFVAPIKTVGHGTTTTKDLRNNIEVFDVITELSVNVGQRLRLAKLKARGISIAVRDNKLSYKEYQAQIPYMTQSAFVLAKYAKDLFKRSYEWQSPIRSLTVRAINLVSENEPQQMNFFIDHEYQTKLETIDVTLDDIRGKYGDVIINAGTHYKSDIGIVKDKTADQTPMTMFN